MTTIGAQLRALRKAAGLSLAAVEQRTEGRWSAALAGSWERGDRHPSATGLDAYLRDVFGRRTVFVPAGVTDEHLAAALRVTAAGVDPAEFDAALAIARLLRGRSGEVLAGWQVPSGLREVA